MAKEYLENYLKITIKMCRDFCTALGRQICFISNSQGLLHPSIIMKPAFLFCQRRNYYCHYLDL